MTIQNLYPKAHRRALSLVGRMRRTTSILIALSSTAVLIGCESPFAQSGRQRDWDLYAQSVLARAVADGSLNHAQIRNMSVNQGVHELTGADTSAATAQSPGGAVIPAGYHLIAAAGHTNGARGAALYNSEPVVRLSLQQVVMLAMRNSLEIKVVAYNPAISQTQLVAARAAFDASVFGDSNFISTDQPTSYNAHGAAGSPGQTNQVGWDNQVGVQKLLGWGGTAQISTGDNFLDQAASPGFQSNINPSNAAFVNLTLSQPLLRGFGADVARSGIYIAQTNVNLALAAFRSQVTAIVKTVESDYYQLVAADRTLEIQKSLLGWSQVTLADVKNRGIFDASSVQVAQAQSAVAQNRSAVIAAQAVLRNASDSLKNLLNDPALDTSGNMLILPADKLVVEPFMFNVADQITSALRLRSVMVEDRLKLRAADINVRVASNALLPQADLTLSTQSNGLSREFGDAFNQTLSPARYFNYSAGLSVSFPIGNRAARAGFREQRLLRRQTLTQMLLDAQNIILQIKSELRALLTSYQQMQAQRAASRAADKVVRALNIQQRFGASLTPTFLNLKLTAQQNLAQARIATLQAEVNYNTALTALQAANGTLLDVNRIRLAPVAEFSSPHSPRR